MKTLQQYHVQEERITKRFLDNRDAALSAFLKTGNIWCHSSELETFHQKWDVKWNRIQRARTNVFNEISKQFVDNR